MMIHWEIIQASESKRLLLLGKNIEHITLKMLPFTFPPNRREMKQHSGHPAFLQDATSNQPTYPFKAESWKSPPINPCQQRTQEGLWELPLLGRHPALSLSI